MDGRTDKQTGKQTDNANFIGPSVGQGGGAKIQQGSAVT